MRPIPEESTDISYSAFPKQDMLEMARALGANNINIVTTACLDPFRVLFHSCVNNVQAQLKNQSWQEDIQGKLIADHADKIYALTRDEYGRQLEHTRAGMVKKYQVVSDFLHVLASEEARPWNAADFDKRWPAGDTARFPTAGSNALETYRKVKENIREGIYASAEGWDALKATQWWAERNLEYKEYRDQSRQLVNREMEKQFPPEAFLTYRHPADRTTLIVTAGMGGGKSHFTQSHLAQLEPHESRNIILHDADYIKPALARSALRDGRITRYTGPEVHNESSNALYENTIKRRYFARHGNKAPNVIVNSTIAGSYEVEDGLEGGGKVEVHHISIDFDHALRATRARAASGGRMPEEEAVRWSVKASPQNLLQVCRNYGGKPITVHLYERADASAQRFGVMDVQNRMVTLTDLEAFLRLAARAELEPERQKPENPSEKKHTGDEAESSEPDGQELVYQTRVSLDKSQMQIDDRLVNLSPGMAVTVEIKTGSRRIIEYLLSPIFRHKQHAMREQ